MRSMTGYGKGMARNDQFEVTIEIKGVNNRFLDLSIRLPKELNAEEVYIREAIKSKVHRGKVLVFVNVEQNPEGSEELFIDWPALEKRYQQLRSIRQKLNLKDEVQLDHLLQFSELLAPNLEAVAETQIKPLITEALESALNAFIEMKEQEGRNILNDVQSRLKLVEKLTTEIQNIAPENVKKEFERLYENVRSLMEEQKIDVARLEQEIAILSDRVDITEECVRLISHIDLFKKTLNNGGDMGKRLNFILQEMHREANTINSKTTMVEIAHRVITVKEEIEKLREQVQNIE